MRAAREEANTKGAAREGRAAFSGKKEDNVVVRNYHETVLSGKLRQAVRRATNREGGGCLLPGDKDGVRKSSGVCRP